MKQRIRFSESYIRKNTAAKKKKVHCFSPAPEQKPIKNWEEWQANALASALLMPRDMLLEDMNMFGLGEHIDILTPINSIFKFAFNQGLIKKNPCLRCTLPKINLDGIVEEDHSGDKIQFFDVKQAKMEAGFI